MTRQLQKSITIVLIVGIAATLALNLYMRGETRRSEGFSELSLNGHRDMPARMYLDETYNVSFTFANHELQPQTYFYEVDSGIIKSRRNITLTDGESATIKLVLTPTGRNYNVTWLMESNGTERFTAEILTNTASFKVSGYGEILHENITVEELEKRPHKTHFESNSTGGQTEEYSSADTTLVASNGTLTAYTVKRSVQQQSVKKPFIVKVYRGGSRLGDTLDVYFWYEII